MPAQRNTPANTNPMSSTRPLIVVPGPSELRRPRPFNEVMAETRRLALSDPALARYAPGAAVGNPRYNNNLRRANERRRQEAIERRTNMARPVTRTASGRASRAKYANPQERRAGALAKRRATIATRQASRLQSVVIDIATDIPAPAPRPSLTRDERMARREAARAASMLRIEDPVVSANPETNVGRGTDYKVAFDNFDLSRPDHKGALKNALLAIARSGPPGARLQIVLESEGGEAGGKYFSTKMGTIDALERYYAGMEDGLSQSERAFARAGTATVKVRPTSGGSGGLFVPDFLTKGYGVTIIRNEDNSCGLRCLVLGMAPDVKRRNLLKKARASQLTTEVLKLSREIDQEPSDAMSFTDFDKFTAKHPDYQIVFLSKGPQGVVFTYETEAKVDEPDKIHIFWDSEQSHYHLIHDVNKFTNDRGYNHKWCDKCHKSVLKAHFANHKCVDVKCKCCTSRFATESQLQEHMAPKQWRSCHKCNMPMVSDECQAAHVCDGKSWRCGGCKKWMLSEQKDAHVCGEKKCEACGEYYTGDNHRCFIQKLENNEDHSEDPQYWVYDFESRMIASAHGSTHEVDTVVAMKMYSDEQESFTDLGSFVKWTMEQKKTTFIAHNARSYDGWLVWQYLLHNTHERPGDLVLAGNKVMLMKYKSNRFIDSLSHVASSLEGLPKIFGLDQSQFKKGFFPYRFNTPENAGYVGPIPAKEWYDPQMMKCCGRCEINKQKARDDGKKFKPCCKHVDFEQWHPKQEGIEFDLDKERYEYCVSDVLILKKAMETYRDLCIDTFKLDPLKCVTIASFCMKNFRTNFMAEENLAVLTKDEYSFIQRSFCGGRTNASKLYRKWTPDELDQGICGRKIDIQSLYPTTQFYDQIPVGVPRWAEEEIEFATQDAMREYIDNHFGFIECDVVCPKRDFFPTLPEHKDGKLIFDLSDKNKMVFTSAELGRAVDKGYKVTRVYKALVFEKSTSVFKDYVATLLKGKVQASGMPGGNLDEFIAEHERRFGFTLDKANLERNEGLRSLYKICLNSLWGKLAEKCERKEDKYCTSESQWFGLMSKHIKGEIEITGSWIIGSSIHAQFKQLDDKKTALARTNLAVASFVTSNARLRLGEKLDILGPRAFYFDTDSILYHYDPSLPNIEEGEYLGDWEKENKTPIVEFCAMGPKSYAVREANDKSETKMKGFTLHHENAAEVNLKTMKKLVDGTVEAIVGKHLNFIKKAGGIHTRVEPKSAVFSYTKRRLVGAYDTVPIGWEGENPTFV